MISFAKNKLFFFGLLFYFLVSCANSANVSDVFTRVFIGVKLNSGILETLNYTTIKKCAAKCSHKSIVGFNFNKNGTCELLAKQENLTSADFIAYNNYSYYISQNFNPCRSNPCLYGGFCTVTRDRMDYKCVDCPYPTAGKNCSELSCGTICFRHKDTVFFMYNVTTVWIEAYNYCNNKGMTMAMMKDTDTHQTIKTFFLNMYAKRKKDREAIWFGLNRTDVNSRWKWVDGTRLENYKGWATGYPTNDPNDLCGNIANGEKYAFDWADDPCLKCSGWEYYPLCEKRFLFFSHRSRMINP